jgi:hypothetical protein
MDLNVDWKTIYWWGSIVSTALTVLICLTVRIVKIWQRRCKNCCSFRVKRRHMLIPSTDSCGGSFHFHSYTFNDCRRCRGAELVKSEDKDFLWIEWYWRCRFSPEQFRVDNDLFRRAGLDVPSSNFFLLERIRATQIAGDVLLGK